MDIGVLRYYYAIGPTSGTDLELRPPPGIEYVILSLSGSVNSVVGSPYLSWIWHDKRPGVTDPAYQTGILLATTANQPFNIGWGSNGTTPYTGSNSPRMKITNYVYPTLHGSSMTNANLILTGMYLERPENLEMNVLLWLSSALGKPLPLNITLSDFNTNYGNSGQSAPGSGGGGGGSGAALS
jgi:hypothetical protein